MDNINIYICLRKENRSCILDLGADTLMRLIFFTIIKLILT